MVRQSQDQNEIKRWAELRSGKPAVTSTPGYDADRSGVVTPHIHFYDEDISDGRTKEISWEDFFKIMNDNGLAFILDDDGNSRFHQIIKVGP